MSGAKRAKLRDCEEATMTLNDRGTHGYGWSSLRAARSLAFFLVAGLIMAACVNQSPNESGNSKPGDSTNAQELAFARCMRSHQVINYPDPSASGVLPKRSPQELGVSVSQFAAANTSCQHLLPGGGVVNQSAQAQVRANALKYSECVREHGVENFPDPASDGRIPDPATVGVNQGSPKFEAANQACAKYRPPYMPSNAAYNAYVNGS
jgi:hypothetical protein